MGPRFLEHVPRRVDVEPGLAAHAAGVGDELIIQLGEESVGVSPIVDGAPGIVNDERIFPTLGVALVGTTTVGAGAARRTVGDQLPAETFEPLSPKTLRDIEHAVARQRVRNERQDSEFLKAALTRRMPLSELEREYIQLVLEDESGNKTRAAQRLGLDRKTLYRKLDEYARQKSEGS